jgi:hypothetical protein
VVNAELLESLGDLRSELARRFQNERTRHSCARPALFETGKHRQNERGRLACPGLGDADDVAALIGRWNGLRLNWRRRIEAGGGDCVEYFLAKA